MCLGSDADEARTRNHSISRHAHSTTEPQRSPEAPDEMLHDEAFTLDLHFSPRQKQSSEYHKVGQGKPRLVTGANMIGPTSPNSSYKDPTSLALWFKRRICLSLFLSYMCVVAIVVR